MPNNRNRNALKHGVFADAIILPGEDPEEFEKLYNDVKGEWSPDGPSEHDCVFSLAKNKWRKCRIARYYKSKVALMVKVDNQFHNYEDNILVTLENIRKFIHSDNCGPITEQGVTAKFGESWGEYFRTYVPREKYQNDKDWLAAIEKTIDWYIEKIMSDDPTVPTIHDFLSDETFMERELAIEERLDAMDDKTITRLGKIKTMKAIGIGNRRTSATNESSNVKALPKVEAPAIQAAEDEEDNQES